MTTYDWNGQGGLGSPTASTATIRPDAFVFAQIGTVQRDLGGSGLPNYLERRERV